LRKRPATSKHWIIVWFQHEWHNLLSSLVDFFQSGSVWGKNYQSKSFQAARLWDVCEAKLFARHKTDRHIRGVRV